MCCRGCVLLVLSFSSFGALPLEASCSWIMIWLLGCCCSKELGVLILRVDGVVVCCTLSLGVCRSIQMVVMQVDLVACCDLLCSSWFALCYCSAFSLSLNFGIGLLVGRGFGQVKVSALVARELRGAFLTCVRVLWADRFRFEVGSKFVTQVLLGCCDVSSDIPELEWWSKLKQNHFRVPFLSLLAVLVL